MGFHNDAQFTTFIFQVYCLWNNKDFIGTGGDKGISTLH